MRTYSCYYFYRSKDKLTLYPSNNRACWAGVSNNIAYLPKDQQKPYPHDNRVSKDSYDTNYIYITDYIQAEVSDKDRSRIVFLLNKIIDCKFITIDNVVYIKIKLLDNYDSNLILLNFIRMLWNKPANFNITQYYKDVHNHIKKNEDSLSFLLKCVRDNVSTKVGYGTYEDHSIIYEDIKLKTFTELLEYKGTSVQEFLTN